MQMSFGENKAKNMKSKKLTFFMHFNIDAILHSCLS